MARARRAPFFQANLGVFGSGRLTASSGCSLLPG